jgi:hypothetical protein
MFQKHAAIEFGKLRRRDYALSQGLLHAMVPRVLWPCSRGCFLLSESARARQVLTRARQVLTRNNIVAVQRVGVAAKLAHSTNRNLRCATNVLIMRGSEENDQ